MSQNANGSAAPRDHRAKGGKGKKKFIPLSEFGSSATSSARPERNLEPAPVPPEVPKNDDQPPTSAEDLEDAKEELCFICADAITWYAVGECNHRVCHLCSLRLRALYKQKTCAMCKTELGAIVYTKDPEKPYSEFDLKSLPAHDRKLNIYFDDPEIHGDVLILLRFNCPDPACDVACNGGWKELKDHVKKAHGMQMCDLCTRHKKLFTHEHTLYTPASLERHKKSGDPDDPSFKGHPQCGFCRTYFYGHDELYEHCREKHEQCFLCQQNGIRNQYFNNYAELEKHFHTDHFPCMHPDCLEQKFVVFSSDIDLKGHELEVHGDAKLRARGQQLDLAFTYAGGANREREGARSAGRRGGNRSRPATPQSSTSAPINGSGAMTVVSHQEEQTRRLRPPPGFGAQLSDGRTSSETGGLASEAPVNPTASTPTDPEIMQRMQHLFNSDVSKLTEFKSLTQSYRNDLISADELVKSFMQLALSAKTSRPAKETESEAGILWRKLADTVPGATTLSNSGGRNGSALPSSENKKRNEMLRAWNDWKVRNSDFPAPKKSTPSYASASASSGPSGGSNSGNNGSRVLVIKNNASRQRFGRGGWGSGVGRSMSNASRETVWEQVANNMDGRGPANGRSVSASEDTEKALPIKFADVVEAPRAAQASVSDFPGLGSSTRPTAGTSSTTPTQATTSYRATVQSSATPTQATTSYRATVQSSGKPSGRTVVNKEEFPGLPSRPPPPPMNRAINGRIGTGASSSGWGNKASPGSPASSTEDKKGKKGKQVLMHFGR
ncbi:hypothetical protein BC832DRAFT_565461 [Gaertneriomyces semiglobifer]|nr:hypothetical protein BC832DRAFT_565461 [Gaertneriomyces semiglobifer]